MNSQNGWNTDSGGKYVVYNKQEEHKKQSLDWQCIQRNILEI